ncbi:MAG: GNAT family N-acetyltransferase [Clostridiales bacterium]|nr:GNAT family N-acetyltransferase [Clostridiales bacterium]
MIDFQKGKEADFARVCALYQKGIAHMEAQGLEQWSWGIYPNETLIQEDLAKEESFLLFVKGELAGVFVLNDYQDPEYLSVPWQYGLRPLMMHRLMIDPDLQKQGLGKAVMDWIFSYGKEQGYDSIRLDTYSQNLGALALYRKMGYRESGIVHFREKEGPFICFEMPLSPSCPLLPIPMVPAFRHGKDTPWGGDALKRLYRKNTPDNRTGESLEVSAIPGLVSRTLQGEGLDELLALHGENLQGSAVKGPFPLLLKLLDAREPLSVQVHPDDSYAATYEGGKLGKTEAWLILHAPPGAQLVYGIKKGTSKEELLKASKEGKAVEALLRKVTVQPGDLLFIPAGCVHAIGAGIVLYEIQQSSDVTYRFYDWDRTDAKGQKRELHFEKAIAVTDVSFQLDPIRASHEKEGMVPLLENPVFVTVQLNVQGSFQLDKDPRRFRMITALDPLTINSGGSILSVQAGQTVLFPALCPSVTFTGKGRAILSAPTV